MKRFLLTAVYSIICVGAIAAVTYSGSNIGDAPRDGALYGRKDGLWQIATNSGSSTGGSSVFVDGATVTNINLKSNRYRLWTISGTNATSSPALPVTLTFSTTNLATDASLSCSFRVVLTNSISLPAYLQNPTNPDDDQEITWTFIQGSSGNAQVLLGSAFNPGSLVTDLYVSTNANSRSYLKARYNATAAKWDLVANAWGFAQ